ncbi:hypothetical protein [Rhizobium hainanense]|uniref:Uncharacterized protein n=1 Tax=Rhizobium hainanense TaxID=52131 RepID=A0A1C3WG90_9HYPH|nr:hypothetical protein [Rhizobium hainanense]SCB39000.1 hypothetical protein GA0061100_11840 [Rhizobium hainanense]
MLRIGLFSVAVIFSSAYVFAGNNDKARLENTFECAALYGIWMKMYEEKNEADQVYIYKGKFDRLAKEAETLFKTEGKAKDNFDLKLQQHVDGIARVALKDGRALPSLRAFCDKMFP